jgi:hypothetical protein
MTGITSVLAWRGWATRIAAHICNPYSQNERGGRLLEDQENQEDEPTRPACTGMLLSLSLVS